MSVIYADLAKLAADNGNHHLAADIYILATSYAVGKEAIDGYMIAANQERALALGILPAVQS